MTTLDLFKQQLSFSADGFQEEAMTHIDEGRSVVVCAPTGSGKTLIAEFAAYKAIQEGTKLFYTTPLKALSNQKYHDFKARYGDEAVGLLTGDISINRDARLVVMTTEVFRNMLYGIKEDSQVLREVDYVVLDECHFMNDAQRGTVWEESMIYCPASIQLIALSATVANAEELTAWIDQVHGNTVLVSSDFRPVPLRFSYYTHEKLMPLFEAPGRMNRQLKPDLKGNRAPKKQGQFIPNKLIIEMNQKNMLPGIFFTFSRKGCDSYMEATKVLNILKPEERETLRQSVEEFVEQHPILQDHPMLEHLKNGFASHHAGLLPGLKFLVERLFQRGLIKVVFATETLAAGINMPARSTVITAISKRTDDGHRLLNASEFLQMSGRAGRRGMDEVGYVVIIHTPFQGASEAAHLASSPPDPLNSRFTPTYGMVLNVLQKYTLEEAQYLIRKSFGQFTIERRLKPLLDEKADKEAFIKTLEEFACPANLSEVDFEDYLDLKQQLQLTQRQMKDLQHQIKRYGKHPEMMAELNRLSEKRSSTYKLLDVSPCAKCEIYEKHHRAQEQLTRMRRKVKSLASQCELELDIYWKSFMNIYNLLKEAGYLNEDNHPSDKGLFTSKVRYENELYLTELMSRGVFDLLSPPALAGVVCALINDSTRENLYSKLTVSHEIDAVYKILLKEQLHVKRLQNKHHISILLSLNPVASPLIEAWAQQAEWEYLLSKTNMDAGDLVRLTRRTSDLLRQLAAIPQVPKHIRQTAREAFRMIDREPVKDVEMADLRTLLDIEQETELALEAPAPADKPEEVAMLERLFRDSI